MSFKLGKKSLERRAGIDKRLIEIDDLAITLTLVDFGHPEHAGRRTDEEQNQLFKAGVSKCDGYNDRSVHQDGKGLDFYAFVDGKASWEEDHLAMVACAYFQAASILGYKISWGGLWKSNKKKNGINYGWDCPHITLLEE